MDFRIADTFTDSLARLTGDEQKAAKTTAFDLQVDPTNPDMQFHRLDRARDPDFWSVRVNADLRLIVHRAPGSLLLCYVDHHRAMVVVTSCKSYLLWPGKARVKIFSTKFGALSGSFTSRARASLSAERPSVTVGFSRSRAMRSRASIEKPTLYDSWQFPRTEPTATGARCRISS